MFKSVLKLLASILIIFVIFIGGILFWLRDKPQSAKFLGKFLENRISHIYPNYISNIDNVIIAWDKKSNFINIEANNLKISDQKLNIDVALFPKINVNFNLLQIIKLNIFSSEVQIDNPVLNFKILPKENIKAPPVNSSFNQFLSNSKFLKIPFQTIKINNVSVNVNKDDHDYSWNIKNLDVNRENSNKIEIRSKINFEGQEGDILISAAYKKQIYDYHINLSNLNSDLITIFSNDHIKDFNALLNFEANLKTSATEIIEGNFALNDTYGKITDKRNFKINNLKGNIAKNKINFEEFKLVIDNKREISVDGEIAFKGLFGKIEALNINSNINNFKINDIRYFWPSIAVPPIRNWIIANLSNGEIEKASGKFNFNINDAITYNLPAGSIIASVELKGVDLDYYPDFPKLSNVSAIANFDEKAVNINLSAGNIVSSTINSAIINIPFTYKSAVKIQGKASGDISDIAEFIPKDIVKNTKESNIDLHKIIGKALTEVDIEIPLNPNSTIEEYKFLIKSELKNISLGNLPNNLDMKEGELKVVFDGEKVTVKGNTLLGNSPTTIDWLGYTKAESPFDSRLLLNTKLLPKSISLSKNIDFTEGHIDINAKVITKSKTKNISIEAILDNASVDFKRLGYKKPLGKSIKANIEASIKQDKIIKISDLNIEGDEILISGKGDLDQTTLDPINLDLPVIKFNNNDIKLKLDTKNSKAHLDIQGKHLNLSQADFTNFSSSKTNLLHEEDFKIEIDKIKLKNDQEFNKFKANIKCIINQCNFADITSLIGDNYNFEITLTPQDSNKSELKIKSDNASAIFKAFDINKNFKAGALKIKAIKSVNTENHSRYDGKIKMTNFIVAKTPILSKLFTFTSLPKLIEIPFAILPGENIKSNDIPFTNFMGDFIFQTNNLIINNGTVEGPQLGLTIDGFINTNRSELNFSGTIIPELLGISKVINNIPLLGTIIQGGKNKGLLAASYSIKGPYSDVQTFVNPLSMLTPGFLRNIFSMFEVNRSKHSDVEE